jgi:serine/threonine-protein kinase
MSDVPDRSKRPKHPSVPDRGSVGHAAAAALRDRRDDDEANGHHTRREDFSGMISRRQDDSLQAPPAPEADASAGLVDPHVGRTIQNRFRIDRLIARGGMGRVYFGEQIALSRPCAIKVMSPVTSDGDPTEFHRRFFLEASIASKLTHPNNVTIFDYGQTSDDVYYIAMEYLEGRTLARALREDKWFAPERAGHVARQLCRALREAHALGVVHRDLKPANIFLMHRDEDDDFVKVLDFGLVKEVTTNKEQLTGTGQFMGSPRYMAPEQINGADVDARCDIYSLGVILYEMLTGSVPFERSTDIAVLMAHLNDDVPPLRTTNPNIDISPRLERLVLKCLAKRPEDRFASTDEVLTELRHIDGAALTRSQSVEQKGAESGPHVRSATSLASLPPLAITGETSQPNPSVRLSQPPSARTGEVESPRKPKPAMFVVIGLVALAAVGGVAVWRSNATPEASSAPTVAEITKTADVPSATEAPAATASAATTAAGAAARVVRVKITSEPAGASVKEDGVEVCASTPCEVVYRGKEADPTIERVYLVSKVGFSVVRVKASGASPEVATKLTPVRAYVPPPQPQQQKHLNLDSTGYRGLD